MRKTILMPFLALALLSSHCGGQAQTPSGAPNADASPEQSLEGDFRSVMGVMDPLSCHAYNAGYLTLENGDRVSVSFDALSDQAIDCEQLRVTGSYITSSQDGQSGVCPKEDRRIFVAKAYECL